MIFIKQLFLFIHTTSGAVFTKHFILQLGVHLTRAKTLYVGVFS